MKIQSYNFVRAEFFGKKPSKVDRIIGLRSRPHIHTEAQFSDLFDKVSCSATKAEGSNCVRFKDIGYSHAAERWDTVDVPMSPEHENRAYAKAQELEGMPYDLIGQLCHITPLKIWLPSKKKIWCSKAVAQIIYAGRQDFEKFMVKYGLMDELRPDQLDMMARYYFR